MTTPEARFEAFARHDGRVSLDDLFAFFDGLDAVDPQSMLGEWTGGVFDTGHGSILGSGAYSAYI